MSFKYLRFGEITFNDINKSMFNCRLGLELAILSNVVAYYCSDIGNYKMAAKLYGAAWCFIYNDPKMGLVTLQNLRRAYKNLDDRVNVGIVDKEIAKLKNNKDMIEKAS